MRGARPQDPGSRATAVTALMSRYRSIGPMPARREGMIRLLPNQAHTLVLSLPFGTLVLSRDDAGWLAAQLSNTGPVGHMLALQFPASQAFLTEDDVRWVRAALAAFEREMGVEDQRGDDRLHPAVLKVEV